MLDSLVLMSYALVIYKKRYYRASLVAQWLRIHLAMQGTWVHWFSPWSGKSLHAAGQLSPCARATEPVL